MKTLAELKKEFKNAPKMLLAVNRAIEDNGDSAAAIIVPGQTTTRRGSNCDKAAIAARFDSYTVYPGAKRRFKTEGYANVVVGV